MPSYRHTVFSSFSLFGIFALISCLLPGEYVLRDQPSLLLNSGCFQNRLLSCWLLCLNASLQRSYSFLAPCSNAEDITNSVSKSDRLSSQEMHTVSIAEVLRSVVVFVFASCPSPTSFLFFLVEERFGSCYCTTFLLWDFAELLEQISLNFWLIPLLVCGANFCLGRFLLVGRSRFSIFICMILQCGGNKFSGFHFDLCGSAPCFFVS